MFTWIDGHLLLALIVVPIFVVWLVGYINFRIRVRAHQRIDKES